MKTPLRRAAGHRTLGRIKAREPARMMPYLLGCAVRCRWPESGCGQRWICWLENARGRAGWRVSRRSKGKGLGGFPTGFCGYADSGPPREWERPPAALRCCGQHANRRDPRRSHRAGGAASRSHAPRGNAGRALRVRSWRRTRSARTCSHAGAWEPECPFSFPRFFVPTLQRGNAVRPLQRPVASRDAGAWEPDQSLIR